MTSQPRSRGPAPAARAAVGRHSLAWSYLLGHIARAEDQPGHPGADPRMRGLDALTRDDHQRYNDHVRARHRGLEDAARVADELRRSERPVRYDLPVPPGPEGARRFRLPPKPGA